MKEQKMASATHQAAASNAKDILRTRARALARPVETFKTGSAAIHVVEFRLAQERYAVEQHYVQEVHPLQTLTLLPCTPAFVVGVINLRGQILPVIDIKKFFDLPDNGITDMHMVVIVRENDMEIGILADTVTGTGTILLETIQPSLPTLTGIRAAYLKGVTGDQVVVLDVSKILADPKILVNEEVET
jgi:purine-binding chemotaxis protein CheW